MFHKVFKDIMKRWHRSYRFHRRSHECGVREAASWAWWNAWNPLKYDGSGNWRNSYISDEAQKVYDKEKKEMRSRMDRISKSESIHRKNWQQFQGLTVETHLERAKADNKANMAELQKSIKKAEKKSKKA